MYVERIVSFFAVFKSIGLTQEIDTIQMWLFIEYLEIKSSLKL